MAARTLRPRHQDEIPYKYYVYQFFEHGICVYVGKGSNDRFNNQRRRFNKSVGYIIAYFISEEDSLIHENMLIKQLMPPYNKALMPKYANPWTKSLVPERNMDFYAWCNAIGNRQMAIRVLLSRDWISLSKYNVDIKTLLSKLDPWCEVLNGTRA
jgi:hypothetical protein